MLGYSVSMDIISFILLSIALGPFESKLELAGENRSEIEHALAHVPEEQTAGMEWLIEHMPIEDLKTLTADFLLTNCDLAYQSIEDAPWGTEIPEAIFFDAILPYANVNERRENWRSEFAGRFADIVKDAKTPSEAAVLLNQQIFNRVGVKYSTKRPKADQSPFESIDAGLASCSGLSILLIDACRSVGVPARFAGTPLWYNKTGNHSWVEIWDDGWHFTGAAEPTGDELNKGWFTGSASKATKGHPDHAIYAVTWQDSGKHFPLVWRPNDKTYRAIDVTDRYAKESKSAKIPTRIKSVIGDTRIEQEVVVLDEDGEQLFEGLTNGERADSNDHVTVLADHSDVLTIVSPTDIAVVEVIEETVCVLNGDSLTPDRASDLSTQVWESKNQRLISEHAESHENRVIKHGEYSMPYWYTVFGDAKAGDRSLWISMHGGGGAPPSVNTNQWHNQKKLYTLDEGVYLTPRAPTDTWNLWHQSHIDPMFEALIEQMIVFEGVDPNRVFIIGYSAGGDGVYQLAPRMADKLAAAGMMAGHPNETKPDGLRNIGFALHMGEKDGMYDRNKVAENWKTQLSELQKEDSDGYKHQVVIHKDKGHWMGGLDSQALPWLSEFTRNPYPQKIVWLQDDVLHNQFYWLSVNEPNTRDKTIAEISGQTITIQTSHQGSMTIYLNDQMLDLDLPVIIVVNDSQPTVHKVRRDASVIHESMRDYQDWYSAKIDVTVQ